MAVEAEGEESRVPAINTKSQEEEWNSVGRILIKGFTDHAVFPLKLNKAFTIALLMVRNTSVLKCGCKLIPTEKDQIRFQIIQIAHNQLIQKPKYALDKI